MTTKKMDTSLFFQEQDLRSLYEFLALLASWRLIKLLFFRGGCVSPEEERTKIFQI